LRNLGTQRFQVLYRHYVATARRASAGPTALVAAVAGENYVGEWRDYFGALGLHRPAGNLPARSPRHLTMPGRILQAKAPVVRQTGSFLGGPRCRNGPCSERTIDVAVLR